jgi:CheY-like chemotaxis protein
MLELNKIPAIILLDDEEIINLINKTVIRRSGYKGEIFDFETVDSALSFIRKLLDENRSPTTPYLLLLDLNMPEFSGWDFLNNFLSLEEEEKKQFKIVILTSSVDPNDVTKSSKYKDITSFSIKPLTQKSFFKIIESIKTES